MEFRSLEALTIRDMNDALLRAFSDYFVKLPDDVDYWAGRMRAARYDPALSYGAWENGEMMAFIFHGIDTYHGARTAFNTGTGVYAEFRGRGLVDALYVHALPRLRAAGIERCALEVIVDNHRAIRVYDRIGFRTARRVCCFRGELPLDAPGVQVTDVDFAAIATLPGRQLDDWENCNEGILAVQDLLRICAVSHGGSLVGHFAINPKSGLLSRAEVADPDNPEHWRLLLQGAAQVSLVRAGEAQDRRLVRMNNVDIARTDLRQGFLAAGMANPVDQFEMVMDL